VKYMKYLTRIPIMNSLPQILIRRVVGLPLSGETMDPSIPPRLWRGSRTMPGSPRSESPVVHSLHSPQRNLSSLSNFSEGFSSRIHLPKFLGVGGSFCLLSLISSELGVVPLEHLLITCLNPCESLKPPEYLRVRRSYPRIYAVAQLFE